MCVTILYMTASMRKCQQLSLRIEPCLPASVQSRAKSDPDEIFQRETDGVSRRPLTKANRATQGRSGYKAVPVTAPIARVSARSRP